MFAFARSQLRRRMRPLPPCAVFPRGARPTSGGWGPRTALTPCCCPSAPTRAGTRRYASSGGIQFMCVCFVYVCMYVGASVYIYQRVCVCVRMCACARTRACARARACVCVCDRERVCEREGGVHVCACPTPESKPTFLHTPWVEVEVLRARVCNIANLFNLDSIPNIRMLRSRSTLRTCLTPSAPASCCQKTGSHSWPQRWVGGAHARAHAHTHTHTHTHIYKHTHHTCTCTHTTRNTHAHMQASMIHPWLLASDRPMQLTPVFRAATAGVAPANAADADPLPLKSPPPKFCETHLD
jgi:hypothetical protein